MSQKVPDTAKMRYSKRIKGEKPKIESSATADSERCALLALAPELRNRIYEFALTEEDGYVEVTSTLKEPGLLSTCKQIRSESRGIWFASNIFFHQMIDCDATIIGRFKRWVEEQDPLPEMSLSHMQGRPHWANLEKWCEEVQSGRSFGVGPPDPETADVDGDVDAVVRGAVSLAVDMMHLSWEECKAPLVSFRYVAGRIDKRWLQD